MSFVRYGLGTLCALSAAAFCSAGLSACDDGATNTVAGSTSSSSGGGGGSSGGGATGGAGGSGGMSSGSGGFIPGTGGSTSVPQYAELWYSVEDRLVRFPLNPADGNVQAYEQSIISNPPPAGQNLLTMMPDGSLIGGRLSFADDRTYFYHVPAPPRNGGTTIAVVELGQMIDDLMLEGLYTDCEGRLYGMDTGADASSSTGNRLIRFTGDFLASDFSYVVVSDLNMADVADIDDMSPGISNNEVTDNPGLAIDSGTVHAFDYETGSGMQVGAGGTWGIHALGGALFDDDVSRLFLLSSAGEVFEMDPTTYVVSPVLGIGPTDVTGNPGHSGLAGPLTDCNSGFTPPS